MPCKAADLYVPGSGAYDDYRTQLLPWAQCEAQLGRYGQAVGLPTSGHDLVATLRRRLNELVTEVDNGFPDNSELTIDPDGTPHLKRQRSKPLPRICRPSRRPFRMPERHLLDILKHVHHWYPNTAISGRHPGRTRSSRMPPDAICSRSSGSAAIWVRARPRAMSRRASTGKHSTGSMPNTLMRQAGSRGR